MKSFTQCSIQNFGPAIPGAAFVLRLLRPVKIIPFLCLGLCCLALVGCATSKKLKVGTTLKIDRGPETQVAELGTLIQFSVSASPTGSVSYQWVFNGVEIPGATSREYILNSVSFTDVGSYAVKVFYGATNILSSTAYLSVYQLNATNSNGGTMTMPVGLFAPMAYSCGSPAIAFTMGYSPQDSTGPLFFYGPAATGMTGPFVNSSYSPNLRLDTTLSGVTSGVRLQKSFSPPPYDIDCKSGLTGAVLGPISLNATSTVAKYRATFYSNVALPATGTITFTWSYF